jgi:Lar family restriction alleviation protein
MTDELKECPFCGCKAMLYVRLDNRNLSFIYQPMCSDTWQCKATITEFYDSRSKAARAWNTRYVAPQQEVFDQI